MTGRRLPAFRGWSILLVVVGGIAALAGPAAFAQDDRPPTVESVLRKTADFYKKAKTIAVDVEREQTMGGPAQKSTFKAAFQRPNRMAIRLDSEETHVETISDGTSQYVFIGGPLKKYTQAKAPASLDELSGQAITLGILQGSCLAELVADDPYAKLMEGVTSSKYVGTEVIDGAKAHRLKFIQEQFDWELWVAAAGDPVIRRATMDFTKSVANGPLAEQLKGKKLEATNSFKNWKFDKDLDKATFTFEPPKDAKKVDSFEEGKEEPSPLIGKPAPEISLNRLVKGKFKLADAHGKHPVMIDFWATWCGPCVMELPILADVAREYKEKGIVFCAVNLREKPDEIKTFLDKKKLDIPVALDTEGAVAETYKVEGIPTLILIDAKGVVQAVHVGYDPELRTVLPKELDALLAGKNLAKEKPENSRPAASDNATEKKKPGDPKP